MGLVNVFEENILKNITPADKGLMAALIDNSEGYRFDEIVNKLVKLIKKEQICDADDAHEVAKAFYREHKGIKAKR